jgi:hypothetical protein
LGLAVAREKYKYIFFAEWVIKIMQDGSDLKMVLHFPALEWYPQEGYTVDSVATLEDRDLADILVS